MFKIYMKIGIVQSMNSPRGIRLHFNHVSLKGGGGAKEE